MSGAVFHDAASASYETTADPASIPRLASTLLIAAASAGLWGLIWGVVTIVW